MPGLTSTTLPITISADKPALSHLSETDRHLFSTFGAGPSQQPMYPTVTSAILAILSSHPDVIAAHTVLPDGALGAGISYGELDRRSDHLAAVLHQHGVGNDDAVPLFITRGFDMLVGIIGILKTGACYVPQDVRLAPQTTTAMITKLTSAKVVLTTSTYLSKVQHVEAPVLAIDSVTETPTLSYAGSSRAARPDDRCYIIFTSGTTGSPKGVQVTQGNVCNILLTAPMDLGMTVGTQVSHILSVAFDMGAWEVLGALTHGSTLIIRGRNIGHAVRFADVIISTPTVLGTIDAQEIADIGRVKQVAVAGEPCPKRLADTWSEFCRFYNSCGPTEVTIVNTASKHIGGGELTIGKPTPNNTVYILDSEQKAVEIGEAGEMWAGGYCVSRGYLNMDKITRERYLADPFVNIDGMRMYKTGDLGRWNENGELEHLGRVDDQVKVKGFRVELDGIARMCEKANGAESAVVLLENNRLVAFVSGTCGENEVKQCVKDGLPYYCMPEQVIMLDELPRTKNGKTDKRKLKALVCAEESECKTTAVVSEQRQTVTTTTVGLRKAAMMKAYQVWVSWQGLATLVGAARMMRRLLLAVVAR